jgi:hypothetical protein
MKKPIKRNIYHQYNPSYYSTIQYQNPENQQFHKLPKNNMNTFENYNIKENNKQWITQNIFGSTITILNDDELNNVIIDSFKYYNKIKNDNT